MGETVCYNPSYNKKTRWRVWNGGKDMKQGRRELNKLQCRDRILKMSRRLFTAKGYGNTTIEDIAAAAEISKATLYNYFSSKEDLLQGIADAAMEEIRLLVREGLQEEKDALAKLRRVMETLAADAARYVALTRRIFYLNVSPESELHGARAELLEILGHLVREAQEQGKLRRDLPTEELVEVFLGIYLLALMGWEDMEHCTEDVCRRRVGRVMDQVLAGLAET